MAENFESRRESGDDRRVPGKPTVAAWTIVVMLILVVLIGFGSLRGRAHPADAMQGARIVNPRHLALCRDLRVPALDKCQAQRSSEPEDRPDQPSAP